MAMGWTQDTADRVTFYRGITVENGMHERAMRAIRTRGLTKDDPYRWGSAGFHDLRPSMKALLHHPALDQNLTRPVMDPVVPAVYATGDHETACWYALRHNRSSRHTRAIVLTFRAPLDEAVVDGSDLLYAGFQFPGRAETKTLLLRLFGPALEPYLDKAWATDAYDRRISYCDLAVLDPDVVRHHYRNQLLINGRHGVNFRSSFLVKLPVPPEQVQCVEEPDEPAWSAPFDALALVTPWSTPKPPRPIEGAVLNFSPRHRQ